MTDFIMPHDMLMSEANRLICVCYHDSVSLRDSVSSTVNLMQLEHISSRERSAFHCSISSALLDTATNRSKSPGLRLPITYSMLLPSNF